jgi:pimeloyl-ACP methyl ester carboxylesterase
MSAIGSPLHVNPTAAISRRRTPLLARIALGTAIVFALAAGSGAAYEMIAGASDSATYPPTGRLVDVGGYRLHLDCYGEGSPAVVMDAGLGGSSLDWSLVQPGLAEATQVCTYDRAGMGWSEAGPGLRSPAHLAEELYMLLKRGGIAGPYVVVGHSLGGKNVRMFAAARPDEVAGMVLVDARSEAVESEADMQSFAATLDARAALYTAARRLGLARLFGAMLVDLAEIPTALAAQMALAQTSERAIAETTREGLSRTANDAALAGANLGSLPLVVIAAGESMRAIPGWPAAQKAMTNLSTNGRLVVADGSPHAVQLAAPDIVIDAVLSVLAEVRENH